MKKKLLLFFCLISSLLYGQETILLKDNLKDAKAGDYVVTNQNKNYTMLHIISTTRDTVTIEEITIPGVKLPERPMNWGEWLKAGAPKNSCFVIYVINLNNGHMIEYFSLTKNGWFEMSEESNFFSTLLNLKLTQIPKEARKRIGPNLFHTNERPIWNPKMVFNGQVIENVEFEAYQTEWPKDGTEMSGRVVEVYLPEKGAVYPAYFPYWLQITGVVGKAKVRIVDSGVGLDAPVMNSKWHKMRY